MAESHLPLKKRKLDLSCITCKIYFFENKKSFTAHLRSTQHLDNSCKDYEGISGIKVIDSAFKNRLSTYRIDRPEEVNKIDIVKFLNVIKESVKKLLHSSLEKFTNIKVGFELFIEYEKWTLNSEDGDTIKNELKSFNSKYIVLCKGTNLEEVYGEMIEKMVVKSDEFQVSLFYIIY